MTDESLIAEMKALLAVRRREDPLIIAMSKDVVQIRKELSGQAQCVNLALGNSRNAVERMDKFEANGEFDALRRIILEQADTIAGMQQEIVTMKHELADFLNWARSKGKR